MQVCIRDYARLLASVGAYPRVLVLQIHVCVCAWDAGEQLHTCELAAAADERSCATCDSISSSFCLKRLTVAFSSCFSTTACFLSRLSISSITCGNYPGKGTGVRVCPEEGPVALCATFCGACCMRGLDLCPKPCPRRYQILSGSGERQ